MIFYHATILLFFLYRISGTYFNVSTPDAFNFLFLGSSIGNYIDSSGIQRFEAYDTWLSLKRSLSQLRKATKFEIHDTNALRRYVSEYALPQFHPPSLLVLR